MPAPRLRTAASSQRAGAFWPSRPSADSFANARARAYRAVDQIDFADGFHRRDIGWRELQREKRMNAFWAYFWPVLGRSGLSRACSAGIRRVPLASEAQDRLRIGALLPRLAAAALWHGPLGSGRSPFEREVEASARNVARLLTR